MSLFSSFHNDRFFAGVDLPTALALEHRPRSNNYDRSRNDNRDRQLTHHRQNNDREIDLFRNPFGHMQDMMDNMHRMMSQVDTRMHSNDFGSNAHGVSFSSSTVMSMDNRNGGQPRIVQATSEKLQGPEGFSRTRKAVRDTGRNLEKMEIAHRLGERGHRIIKERDPASGRLLENREYEYIDDENQFQREWVGRADKFGLRNFQGYEFDKQANNLLITPSSYGRLRSQSQEPRQLAIENGQSKNYHSRSKHH